jgi:predicted aldo/keto reductase-like oxidoreductase
MQEKLCGKTANGRLTSRRELRILKMWIQNNRHETTAPIRAMSNPQREKNTMMNTKYSRRQFLKQTTFAAGTLALAQEGCLRAPAAAKRTAVDQVTLGQTGIKLSRLGMGLGTDTGNTQKALGQDGFNKLVRYAYDQGIRYFDIGESYATFPWLGDAIKGLPREQLFIQSKIDCKPADTTADMVAVIDRHRKTLNTDYIDSMLIHCMVGAAWTDDFKRVMDGFEEAKAKKWIRAKGASFHSVAALRAGVASHWVEVHLVRINPQGVNVDTEQGGYRNDHIDITPIMAQLRNMRAKGRGVIGMKIFGEGTFVEAEDREKSIRFAMSRPELDAIVVGFKSTDEIDEAIKRMNAALSTPA